MSSSNNSTISTSCGTARSPPNQAPQSWPENIRCCTRRRQESLSEPNGSIHVGAASLVSITHEFLDALSPEQLEMICHCLDGYSLARAALLTTSLRSYILVFLTRVVESRGHRPGASFREIVRSDAALFHEHWQTNGWKRQWRLGPSSPPPHAWAAYEEMELRSLALCLKPGCVVIIDGMAERYDLNEMRAILLQKSQELEGMWDVKILWPSEWKETIAERHLSPDPGSQPLCAMVLRGGWQMNFTGLHRNLGRPMRPRRVSFSLCLQRPSNCRSFFNIFFSTQPEPYRDVPFFWAGGLFPPQPADTFSCLLACQTKSNGQEFELWLPSGHNPNCNGAVLDMHRWYNVEISLCWQRMMLEYRILPFRQDDQGTLGTPLFRQPITPFGPHALVEDDGERLRQHLGWQHLYLFTWIEHVGASQPEGPEVQLGEIWIEHEQTEPVDHDSILSMAHPDHEDAGTESASESHTLGSWL